MADFKLRGQVELTFSPNKGVSAIAAQIRKELGGSIPIDLAVKGVNQQSIDPIKNKIREAVKETENLGKGMSSSIQRNTSKSIEEYKKFITNVEKETKRLGKTVNLFDSFVGGVSTRFAQFGKFAIASAGIQKIVQAIDYGFDAIIKINSAQIKLQQITGNTAAEVNKFSSSIIQLSRNVGVASTDLLAASDTLAQAGFGLKTIQGLMKSLANTQLVPTFGNLEKTTEGVVSAIAQFRLIDVDGSTRNVDKFLSTLNTLSKKYAVEAGSIIEAIKGAGGVFAASEGILSERSLGLGQSANADKNLDRLREFGAIITSLRSTTRLSDSVISTGLRTIINRLQDPSVEKKLQEILGANFSLRDTRGEFIGTLQAAEKLNLALQDVGSNTRTFIEVANAIGGGVRQAKIAIPLITTVADSYKALSEARKGDNSLSKDAELAAESLSVKITKIGQDLAAFGVKVAESSGFKLMLDQIREVIKGVTFLLDTLGPGLQVGVAAGLGSIIGPGIYNAVRGSVAGLSGKGPGSLISRGELGIFSGSPVLDKIKVNNPYYGDSATDEVYAALGNRRKGFSKGGYVNAMLMPGEIVFSPEEVKQIGLSNLERLNRQGLQGVDSVPAMLPHGSYVLNKNSTRQMAAGGLYDDNLQPLIDEGRLPKINEFIPTKDALKFLTGVGVKSMIGRNSEVDDRNILSLRTSKDRRFVNSSTLVHELVHHLGLDYEAIQASGKNFPKNYGKHMFNYLSSGSEVDRNFVKANNLDSENPIHLKFAHLFKAQRGYGLLPLEGATVFAEENISFKDLKKILPDTKITSSMVKDIKQASRNAFFQSPSLLGHLHKLRQESEQYFSTGDNDLFNKIKSKDLLDAYYEKTKIYNSSLSDPTLLKRRSALTDYLKSRLPGFAKGGFVGTVPGSGNTDSFPTYLSNGSYVLNKKASKMLRNNSIKRYARGGRKPYSYNPTGSVYSDVGATLGIPQLMAIFDDRLKKQTAVQRSGGIMYNQAKIKAGNIGSVLPHEIAHFLGVDSLSKKYGSVFEPERQASNKISGINQDSREGVAQFLGENKEFRNYLSTLSSTNKLSKKQIVALNQYYRQVTLNSNVLADQAKNIKKQIGLEKAKGAGASQQNISVLQKQLVDTQKKYNASIKSAGERVRKLAIAMNPAIAENLENVFNTGKKIVLQEVVNRSKVKVEQEQAKKTLDRRKVLERQVAAGNTARQVLSRVGYNKVSPSAFRGVFSDALSQERQQTFKKLALTDYAQRTKQELVSLNVPTAQYKELERTKQQLASLKKSTQVGGSLRLQFGAFPGVSLPPAPPILKSVRRQEQKLEKRISVLQKDLPEEKRDPAVIKSIRRQEQKLEKRLKGLTQQISAIDQEQSRFSSARFVGGILQTRDAIATGSYAKGLLNKEDFENRLKTTDRVSTSTQVRERQAIRGDFFKARNIAGQNLIERINAGGGNLSGIKDLNKFLVSLTSTSKDLSLIFPTLVKEVKDYIKIQNTAAYSQRAYVEAIKTNKNAIAQAAGGFTGTSGQSFVSANILNTIKEDKNKPKFIRPDGLTPVQAGNAAIKNFVFGERVDPEISKNARMAAQELPALSGKAREAALQDIALFDQKSSQIEQKRAIRNQRIGSTALAASLIGTMAAGSQNKNIAATGNIIANAGLGASVGVSFGGGPVGAAIGAVAGGGLAGFSMLSQYQKNAEDERKNEAANTIAETVNKGFKFKNDPGAYRNISKQIDTFSRIGKTRFGDKYGLYRGDAETEKSSRKFAYKNAGIALSMITGGTSNLFFDADKKAEEDSYKAQAERDKLNRERIGEYINKTDEALPKILEQTAPDRAELAELSVRQKRGITQPQYQLTSKEAERLKLLQTRLKPIENLEFNSEFFAEIGEQGVSDFEAFTRDPKIRKLSLDDQIKEFTKRQTLQGKDKNKPIPVQNTFADAADRVRKRQQDREKLINKNFDIEDAYKQIENESVDIQVASNRQNILPRLQAISDTTNFNTSSFLEAAEARKSGNLTSYGRATNIGMVLNNRRGYDQNTREKAQKDLENIFGKDSRISNISKETSAIEDFGATFSQNFAKQMQSPDADATQTASSLLNNFLKNSNLENTDTGKVLKQKFDKTILADNQAMLGSEENIKSKLRSGDFQSLINDTIAEGKNIVSQGAEASDQLTGQRINLLNQYSDAKLTERRNRFIPIQQSAEFRDQFEALSGASSVDLAARQADLKKQEVRNLVGTGIGGDYSVQELIDKRSKLGARRDELDINNKNAQQEMANLTTEIKAVDEAMGILSSDTTRAALALSKFEEATKKRNVDKQNALSFALGSDEQREGLIRRKQALKALETGNINYGQLTEEERADLSSAIENERQRDPKKAEELEKKVLLGMDAARGNTLLQQFKAGGNIANISEIDRGEIQKRLNDELKIAEQGGKSKDIRRAKKNLDRFGKSIDQLGILGGVDTSGSEDFAGNKIADLAKTQQEFAATAPQKAELDQALKTKEEAAQYFNDQDKQIITDISNAFNSLNESIKQLGQIDFGSINFDPAIQAAQTFEKAANLLSSAKVNIEGNVTVTGAVTGGGSGGANDTVLASVQSVVDKALTDFATANNMNYSKLS